MQQERARVVRETQRPHAITRRLISGSISLVILSGYGSGDKATSPANAKAVASVTVLPDSASLQIGGTLQLSVVMRDAANNALTGRSVVWTSDNVAVASVSNAGLVVVTAAGGPIRMTATAESKNASAIIVVTALPVATIGPSGGIVMTPIGGASIRFSPGALASSLSVASTAYGCGASS